jgi:ADP-glucose pyrophosphorylase
VFAYPFSAYWVDVGTIAAYSDGCIIHGTVINSVLSPGVYVERGAVVRDSVIMNDTTVLAGAVIDRRVLDKEIEKRKGLSHSRALVPDLRFLRGCDTINEIHRNPRFGTDQV